ncbi:MAG: (2Fe-2S)-binding protein [Campylobacterales bacterium]|nr:(2Fe-2S)-binding protein [Campylobacterales bacterium]
MVNLYLKDDNIKVKVSNSKSLREIARKSGASMEFGCRVGDCSTCVAKVVKGNELLSPITQKEIFALEAMGSSDKDLRLMCQCSINADEGEIEISYFF